MGRRPQPMSRFASSVSALLAVIISVVDGFAFSPCLPSANGGALNLHTTFEDVFDMDTSAATRLIEQDFSPVPIKKPCGSCTTCSCQKKSRVGSARMSAVDGADFE